MRRIALLSRAAAFGVFAAFTVSTLGCASSSNPNTSAAYEENPINHAVTEADKAATQSETPIAADSATLWVNGLGCPLCASNLDIQLKRVKGVEAATVDMSNGTATVTFKHGAARPSPARLAHAVEDAGFTLVKVEAGTVATGGSR